MNIPGLIIEYLISGALALVWLAPLLESYQLSFEGALLPLVALALYVVGMAVDFTAFWLVKPLKPLVRDMAWKRHAKPGQLRHESAYARHVRFALYSPELSKELAMRGSRDRIARGAIVNILALSICVFLGVVQVNLWALIGLLALSVAMWAVFENMSYAYEIRADFELRKKLAEAGGEDRGDKGN